MSARLAVIARCLACLSPVGARHYCDKAPAFVLVEEASPTPQNEAVERLTEQLRGAVEALRMVDAHYAASLDSQPAFVTVVRDVLASIEGGQP